MSSFYPFFNLRKLLYLIDLLVKLTGAKRKKLKVVYI